MLAGHTSHLGQIHLQTATAGEGSFSRPHTTLHPGRVYLPSAVARVGGVNSIHSSFVGFTYGLQQRKRAVLVGHLALGTTLHLGRIHLLSTAANVGTVSRPFASPHFGRIHLQTAAGKEGSVSPPHSTQALPSISVGFAYCL